MIIPMLIISYMQSKCDKRKYSRDSLDEREPENEDKLYMSNMYKIKFKYPQNWHKNNNYVERYEGEEGFFEIFDLKPLSGDIDQVVYQEMTALKSIYGKNCEIKRLLVGGQPARIIVPFTDTVQEHYSIIIKYNEPIKIGNEYYEYIEMHIDPNHVQDITDSLEFIK